jgi:hypothetical protein
MNQQLVDFYLNNGMDHCGRSLSEILSFNDDQLERTHDYIQWLFPLIEPSFYNAQAPLLDKETIVEFQNNQQLRDNVIIAWMRMMKFYLSYNWISCGNHNYLRITRILTFLSYCNLRSQLVCLLAFVLNQHIRYPDLISLETTNYWIAASAITL